MKIKLGGHLSAADGLRHVVLNARALGYNSIQTMLGGGRDYQPYDLTQEDAHEYRRLSFGIETFVHLPYVINPCEDAPQRRSFYKKACKKYMQTAAAIGATGVVIHPGFKKELSDDKAYNNLVKFTESMLEEGQPVQFLVETDAGSKNGSAVGSPALISRLLDDVDSGKAGMVIDTCHLYARGTNLWDPAVLDDFLSDYQHQIRLVHLNVPDPGVTLGSYLDRHNSPFTSRPDLDSDPLIRRLVPRWPCILERRTVSVQYLDVATVQKALSPPDS